jgi:HlyD family secretion protein
MNLPPLNRRALAGLALALALLAGAGLVAYQLWFGDDVLPEGLIQVNGRIEGDRIVVAARYPGRVVRLLAREGDTVQAGQALAQLDDTQARAQVRQARAAVTALASEVEAARRRAEQAERDAVRFRELSAEGTASVREAEQAELGTKVGHDQLASAEAQLGRAQAQLSEAQSVQTDLTIRAPGAGTITTRMADAGEVVAAGAVLFMLVDLDRLYLKVYVPEGLIGKLRLGLPARIYIDAFPDQPFAAELRHIAAQAEFTPKEVQTPDERVKLVYAAKLYLTANPEHRLTPGQPADAVIRWKEDVPWMPPRR